ncbi:MAG: hypothetical protein M1822_006478 [Bathelium mastoideum]|nr:MAG: hypothetical protein M1822_006478 [Bathelium mastoideum]
MPAYNNRLRLSPRVLQQPPSAPEDPFKNFLVSDFYKKTCTLQALANKATPKQLGMGRESQNMKMIEDAAKEITRKHLFMLHAQRKTQIAYNNKDINRKKVNERLRWQLGEAVLIIAGYREAFDSLEHEDDVEDDDLSTWEDYTNTGKTRAAAKDKTVEVEETVDAVDARYAELIQPAIPLVEGDTVNSVTTTVKTIFDKIAYHRADKGSRKPLNIDIVTTAEIINVIMTGIIAIRGETQVMNVCKQGRAANKRNIISNTAIQAARDNHDVPSLYNFYTSLAKAEYTDSNNGQAFTMTVHILALLDTLKQYKDLSTQLADNDPDGEQAGQYAHPHRVIITTEHTIVRRNGVLAFRKWLIDSEGYDKDTVGNKINRRGCFANDQTISRAW